VGDVLRHSIAPIVSRAIWPLLMAKIFGPQSLPPKFAGFPKEMAVRPSQIRASAAESALMIPGALDLQDQYATLKMPVSVVAGEEDRLIDTDTQSLRLHGNIVQSKFHRVPGAGHMVHQTPTGAVMAAIRRVSKDTPSQSHANAKVQDHV
jgi:pimeloyl-ACP methyl ester carboxylesterase